MNESNQHNLLSESRNFGIAIVVVLLMTVGAVFVVSASATITPEASTHKFYQSPAFRQVLFFPIALVILYAASFIDYRRFSLDKGWLRSPTTWILGVSVILLVLVLIPGIGIQVNYARRWLRLPLGPLTINFQPSELAKWSLMFFMAAACCKYNDSLNQFTHRFLPLCGIIAVVCGLIIIEDFGTAAFTGLLAFLTLFLAGARISYLVTPLPFGLIAVVLAIISSPARMQRISAFLHPDKHASAASYQAGQSLIAIASGGILGKGLGMGISKYGHLPEDTTDFIFSIIGEELGFVGAVIVIALFIAFAWLGMKVIIRCKDPFGRLLASGIVFAIVIQAAINIGVVTVVLPTKGIPLPFVSAGGTSLLLSAFAVGILLNIARQSGRGSDLLEEQS